MVVVVTHIGNLFAQVTLLIIVVILIVIIIIIAAAAGVVGGIGIVILMIVIVRLSSGIAVVVVRTTDMSGSMIRIVVIMVGIGTASAITTGRSHATTGNASSGNIIHSDSTSRMKKITDQVICVFRHCGISSQSI